MSIRSVLASRHKEREKLIGQAKELAGRLDPTLGVRAVVVFGSVARGDFNLWSDIDVLVVADHLPERLLDRFDALGPGSPGVQAIPWTPDEYRRQLARRDPIVRDAIEHGVWIAGSASQLAAP